MDNTALTRLRKFQQEDCTISVFLVPEHHHNTHSNKHRCIDIDATSAPRKQCFCQMGYFGEGCARESALSDKIGEEELNAPSSGYQKRPLKDSAWMNLKL